MISRISVEYLESGRIAPVEMRSEIALEMSELVGDLDEWVVVLVAVVRGERLAAGREMMGTRCWALGARQSGGRGRGGRRACARAPLAHHVARFPHGRSYNTPNTKLFHKQLSTSDFTFAVVYFFLRSFFFLLANFAQQWSHR